MESTSIGRRPPHRSPRVWLISFAAWSLPALILTFLPLISMRQEQHEGGVLVMFLRQGLPWYVWALFTPFVLRLAQLWPVGYGRGMRNLLRHVGAATLLGLLFDVGFMGLSYAFRPQGWPEDLSLARALVAGAAFWLPFSYVVYALIASIGTSIEYYTRLRDRELTASRLEARLIEAQLGALRMQLQPHFLFNALNTVAMLVRQGDTTTSVRMIARLSELLRHVLDEAGEPEIPLEQELRLVQRYLDIEQLRFGDRLQFQCDVPAELTAALVPNLLLQPIVENAIRHGISRRAAAGHIALTARRLGDELCIEVVDDGPGLPPQGTVSESGIGLKNTRARLDHLYGAGAALELDNALPTGVRVRMRLPYHVEEQPVAALKQYA